MALVWVAATVNAAEERLSPPIRVEIHTSVLSQAEENTFITDNAPLLATACPGPTQLSSTEQSSGRNSRQSLNCIISATRGYAYSHGLHLQNTVAEHNTAYLPSIRTSDRYIYYLRRIVI